MGPMMSALGVLGVLAVYAFMIWEQNDRARTYILGDLGRIHARNIDVSVDWMGRSRAALTFDVSYTTPDGRRRSNRCVVSTGLLSDCQVTWERPIKSIAGSHG